jgi:hypothetical protein
MSARRRRKRGLLAAIVADPYRKLAAIALAIGLWVFLDNQVSETRRFAVALMTTNIAPIPGNHKLEVRLGNANYLGRRFVADNAVVRAVTLEVRGPKARLEDLEGAGLELTVAADGQSWIENQQTFEFTTRDFGPSEIEGMEITMIPSRVRLEVDRRATRPIALGLDVVALQYDREFESKMQQPVFQPASVTIVGAADSIARLDTRLASGARIFTATLQGSADDPSLTSTVELDPVLANDLGLKIAETRVQVTVPLVAKYTDYDCELILVIDDSSLGEHLRGKYRPDPELEFYPVPVRTRGAIRMHLSSLRDKSTEWAKTYLKLYAFLDPDEVAGGARTEILPKLKLVLSGPQADANPADYEFASVVTITLRRKE